MIAALSIATAAHAQLSHETTSGTATTTTGTAFDVDFTTVPVFSPIYYGGGTLQFKLSSLTDVTFTDTASGGMVLGALMGSSLSHPLAFFGSTSYSETVDLLPGTYTYTASAFSSGPATLYVAVSAVPEPRTYAMLLSGLAAIGVIGLRRRRAPVLGLLALRC